jgi:hypothetical protein
MGRNGAIQVDVLGPIVAVQGTTHIGMQVQVEWLQLLVQFFQVLLQVVRLV